VKTGLKMGRNPISGPATPKAKQNHNITPRQTPDRHTEKSSHKRANEKSGGAAQEGINSGRKKLSHIFFAPRRMRAESKDSVASVRSTKSESAADTLEQSKLVGSAKPRRLRQRKDSEGRHRRGKSMVI